MTRFLHGAAQFWRGGAVVALLVLGGFLYYAYTAPEVYESDALVELTSERGAESSQGSESLRAAVFDPHTLEQLAVDVTPHAADKSATSVIDRARRAIDLRPASDGRFTVLFRGPSAAQAKHGCDSLIAAASQRLAALRSTPSLSPQEEARQRARLVEERTRELASFVAQHPELAGKKSESGEAFLGVPGMRPPSTPAPAPTTDSVLPILQQQKARLEERIAYVEKVELGGAEDTEKLATGDALARMDRASLQKMLVQVKAAIAARQAAAERARANTPSENSAEGTVAALESPGSNPVQTEWQRLVQAVVDAQQQAAQGRDGTAAGLHVVRAAIMPSLPVLPNRRLLSLLGATVGLWAGIVWAFARVVFGQARQEPTQYLPEGLPAFPLEGEAAEPAVPAETTSASRLAAAKAAPLPLPAPPNVPSTPSIPKVPATPMPAKATASSAPTPLKSPLPSPAITPPSQVPEAPAPAKSDALPSFPMEADSAKAAAEATSASRVTTAKTPAPAPVAAAAPKSTATPAHPPAALAATAPAHTAEPPPPPEKRGALPSFPMDADLAKAVEEATSASRSPAPLKPPVDPPNLPKVIIAPEATIPSESKSAPPAPTSAAAAPSVERAAPAAPPPAPPAPPPAPPLERLSHPAYAVPPPDRASSVVAEKALPVLPVESGHGASRPSKETAEPRAPERSPYAAVAEAARTSSIPPPVEPTAASAAVTDARRPSRHPSWTSESNAAHASSRSAHGSHKRGEDKHKRGEDKHAPAENKRADEDSIKPYPIAAIDGAKIEASPIMGIDESKLTAASGKQGISVHPPPVAPGPSPSAAPSPGATMRLGSVSPEYGVSGGSAPPGRRTQTLGTPLAMNPSTAPTHGWMPHAGFGAHQMPPRESDPPPGFASIPPAPKTPSHIGPPITPIGSSRPTSSPAVQSLPITPARQAAASPASTVEAPSTALALARPHSSRSRSEPPAASSVVCDVPKGWAPHPTLVDSETSEELASLRDQLYRLAARECFVVGVSSGPEMAAYKSGVAGRLAWMLAQPGHARILLMEGDFDHPVVHRLMRIDMPLAAGFSEQMRRRMNGSAPGPWTIVRCAPNLYVLAEGLVRSPGLLPTVHFADSVNELRRAYDLIVIDGPAGGMSVDTRALDSVADGIVLAGEADLLDRAATWFGKKQLMAVVSAGPPAPHSR